jgi:hypothetical protein
MPQSKTSQLVDQANEAFRAYSDVNDSHKRASSESDATIGKLGDMIRGDKFEENVTLGDIQKLFKQQEEQRKAAKTLGSKAYAALQAAEASYEIAVEALAKDAGLHEGFQPNARLRRPSVERGETEEKQMVEDQMDQGESEVER